MRPKKEENRAAETVSSDKQVSSKKLCSTVMVKSANAKETVGHRRELNATAGVGQTTEDGCLNGKLRTWK